MSVDIHTKFLSVPNIDALTKINVSDKSIVFILGTGQIYTHGKYFPNLDTVNTLNIATKSWTTTQLNNYLPLTGGKMTGAITAIKETRSVMTTNNLDLATANLFTKTLTGATTFTISNKAVAGDVNSFILELTNGGAFTVTFWVGVKWAGGTVPTLTAAGTDVLGFYSHDGGTTWRGILMAKDSK